MLAAPMSDRRRYPRVKADVLCRPSGLTLFHSKRNTHDISLGGARILSDDDFEIGQRLDLDVLLPDGSTVRCWGEVVWLTPLGNGAPARYDVGVKFTDMDRLDVQRLATVLDRAGLDVF